MRVTLLECQKAFKSPIILSLLILFIVYNIFLIFTSSYHEEELQVVNGLSDKYGVKITDESLIQLEKNLQTEIAVMNTITKQKTGHTFTSAYEFIQQMPFDEYELYSVDDWAFFNVVQMQEIYLLNARNKILDYEQLDFNEVGAETVKQSGIEGVAAEQLIKQYEKVSNRHDEIVNSGEHMNWFFDGGNYRMHSLLFKSVFKHIIFESIILIVLATALISNYEFENRTHLVTFATKKGRKLLRNKLFASLLTGSTATTILLLVTLGTYFIVFDYSYLFNSSINSVFNWETQLPWISWWNLSIANYLVLSIVLVYLCILLFSAMTFGLSIYLENSYYTFFLFALLFVGIYLLQGFIPKSSILFFLSGFNLSSLVLNPHGWFMATKGIMPFKYHELITIVTWFGLISIFSIIAMKRFKKHDIV